MSRDLQNENRILKEQLKLNKAVQERTDSENLHVNNNLGSRLALQGTINKTHNNTRDLYKIYGYKLEPTIEDYINRYLRQDIAKRIVEAYPKACWAVSPEITDDTETEDETEFETQVKDLITNERIKLFHYLRRTDIIAGLGFYGVLFIGVRDGKSPEQPLEGNIRLEDILFLAPYSEVNAAIAEYDTDPQSERYGLPKTYTLSSGGYGGLGTSNASSMMSRKTITVHYSRIIHVTEGALENDVFGTPRLQAIVNRLIDLEKIIGGGAETFFLNARGGIHMNMQPETSLVDTEVLEDRMEEFTNNLTRYLRTKGIDVNTLNFDIADPKNYFEVIMSVISATSGIPKRILTGSEQAQLASSQDANNWAARVIERQKDFCEINMLRPIINWFIKNGIIAAPKDDKYEIIWPDLRTISDMEKADVAVKRTQALSNYINSAGAEMVMPPKQLFEDVLGLEYRENDLPDTDDFDVIEEDGDDQI